MKIQLSEKAKQVIADWWFDQFGGIKSNGDRSEASMFASTSRLHVARRL